MSLVLSCVFAGFCHDRPLPASSLLGEHHAVQSPWFGGDPEDISSTEQMMREHLKKKMKKLEKVPPELIPIEDFVTPTECLDETRERGAPRLSFEESEGRALLLKEWSRCKQKQHMAEMEAVELSLEAQREALEELKLESEELYRAPLKPDPLLIPLLRS